MNIGRIVDGTRAGWRIVKQQASDWTCGCGARIKYYWTHCPTCGSPRPEQED